MGQGTKKVEQGTRTKAKTERPDNDPDNGQFLNSGQGGRQGLDKAWRPTDADQQQGNSQQMKDQDPVEDADDLGDEDDEDEDFAEDDIDADEDFDEDDDLEDGDEGDSDIVAQRGTHGHRTDESLMNNPGRNIY